MKHLLSRRNVGVLAEMAFGRVLLAFDFDGTLAPIVVDRGAAKMRPRTSALFSKICDVYPCAVISGRSRRDVSSRLGSASTAYIVGNHGLEPSSELASSARITARACPILQRALVAVAGVDIENKTYSIAVHFRRARRKVEARTAIEKAVRGLPLRVRMIAGKQVVNIVPAAAPNKGDALLELRQLAKADTALYVGDDVTDEDVFRLDGPGRLLTVRIGASRSSGAAYFLRHQGEIDKMLAELWNLRKGGPLWR